MAIENYTGSLRMCHGARTYTTVRRTSIKFELLYKFIKFIKFNVLKTLKNSKVFLYWIVSSVIQRYWFRKQISLMQKKTQEEKVNEIRSKLNKNISGNLIPFKRLLFNLSVYYTVYNTDCILLFQVYIICNTVYNVSTVTV